MREIDLAAMSGSKGSLESSSHALRSGPAAPAPPVRILRNAPAPDQWTLVSEMNMEKREPCEVRVVSSRYVMVGQRVLSPALVGLEIWGPPSAVQNEG